MNKLLTHLIMLLYLLAGLPLHAQTNVLEFHGCLPDPYRLCEKSEGVRLPDNNQIYLGEGHPDASRGSVHVRQTKNLSASCGAMLTYEVHLIQFDTSAPLILKPATNIDADNYGFAVLTYDSEEALDETLKLNGIPYTNGCDRFHTIRWTVRDSCGNQAVCEERIEVFDCFEPIVKNDSNEVFIINFSVNQNYTINAKNFLGTLVDDWTLRESMLFSIEKDYYLPEATYDCCHATNWGVEVPLVIWVADEGIDLNCDGNIEWTERGVHKKEVLVIYLDGSSGCDCFESTTLAGQIQDKYGNGISGVTVEQKAFHSPYPSSVTSWNGQFDFLHQVGEKAITLSPSKNDNHSNGVSILDLIKLQKYVLGIDDLSAYELIAADVDNSKDINFRDVRDLRNLTMGYYTELPSNTSWRFLPKTFVIPDSNNPWSFPEEIAVLTSEDHFDLDFIGIKIGDLNGTAQPNLTSMETRETLPVISLLKTDASFVAGEIIDVPVRFETEHNLMGMQFTLATDGMEIMDVHSGKVKVSNHDFAVFDEKMTFCWIDLNGVDIKADETLFTLRLRANKPGRLSETLDINSEITAAEIVLGNEQVVRPILKIAKKENSSADFSMICFPNPWRDKTIVTFSLEEAAEVRLTLIDINGVVVHTFSSHFAAGSHQIMISNSDLPEDGLYFYTLSSGEFNKAGKMLLMK